MIEAKSCGTWRKKGNPSRVASGQPQQMNASPNLKCSKQIGFLNLQVTLFLYMTQCYILLGA